MRKVLLMLFICADAVSAAAQIPVELFTGNKGVTLDVLFFKNFKTENKQPSRLLFFNRNRAFINYEQTNTTNLPQFGITASLSYQYPRLKGFAPVAVMQLSNRGVFPKAGIQYAHSNNRFTFFGWVVSETLKNPLFDFFVLSRFTPSLSSNKKLFTQAEFFNSFNRIGTNNNNFIQRLRLGISISDSQFGLAADLSQSGKQAYTSFFNGGVFFRHEF